MRRRRRRGSDVVVRGVSAVVVSQVDTNAAAASSASVTSTPTAVTVVSVEREGVAALEGGGVALEKARIGARVSGRRRKMGRRRAVERRRGGGRVGGGGGRRRRRRVRVRVVVGAGTDARAVAGGHGTATHGMGGGGERRRGLLAGVGWGCVGDGVVGWETAGTGKGEYGLVVDRRATTGTQARVKGREGGRQHQRVCRLSSTGVPRLLELPTLVHNTSWSQSTRRVALAGCVCAGRQHEGGAEADRNHSGEGGGEVERGEAQTSGEDRFVTTKVIQ